MVMMKRDVGELLAAKGVIQPEQLQKAREVQKSTRGDIGRVLVDLNFASESDVLKAKAEANGMRFVDLSSFTIDPSAINVVPAHVAIRHNCVPLTKDAKNLTVAMTDPSNVFALDDLRMASGLKVVPVLAAPDAIQEALGKHYAGTSSNGGASLAGTGGEEGIQGAVFKSALAEYQGSTGGGLDEDAAENMKLADEAPIIRIAHTIIQQAVKDGASDIHVEPSHRNLRVRFRIDGVLHEIMTLPKHIHPPRVSRR
jgi:type IV pilus assembly protein PilB